MNLNRLVKGKERDRILWIEIAIVGAIALFLIFIMPLLLSDFRANLLGRFLALAIVALGIDLIWDTREC